MPAFSYINTVGPQTPNPNMPHLYRFFTIYLFFLLQACPHRGVRTPRPASTRIGTRAATATRLTAAHLSRQPWLSNSTPTHPTRFTANPLAVTAAALARPASWPGRAASARCATTASGTRVRSAAVPVTRCQSLHVSTPPSGPPLLISKRLSASSVPRRTTTPSVLTRRRSLVPQLPQTRRQSRMRRPQQAAKQ